MGASNAPDRDLGMDTLRGLAVLLVVIEHAAVILPHAGPSAVMVFVAALAPFRMPALMFLSGTLLARSLRKPPGRFVLGKVDRLLWPYLLWSVLYYVISLVGNPPSSLGRQLFVDPTSPTWFIGYLFAFFMLSMVLPPRVRSWTIVGTVVVASLLSSSGAGDGFLTRVLPADWQRFLIAFAMFLSGDFFSRHVAWLRPLLRKRTVLLGAGLLAAAAAVVSAEGFSVRWEPLWIVPTLAGLVLLLLGSDAIKAARLGTLLGRTGRRSVVWYLLHWPAQVVTLRLLVLAGVDDPVVLFLSGLAVGIAVPLVFILAERHWSALGYLFDLGLSSAYWRDRVRGAGTVLSAAKWRRPRPR